MKRLLLSLLTLSTLTFSLQAQPVEFVPREEVGSMNVTKDTAPEYGDASASKITSLETLPRDIWTLGGLEDYRLQNDLALMQFSRILDLKKLESRPADLVFTSGLVDITTDPAGTESFGLFNPSVSSISNFRLFPTSVDTEENSDGSASFIVEASDSQNPFLEARTEYRMFKDMPGVLVVTTLTNTSDTETATEITPSDYLRFGGMIPFVPGPGVLTDNSEVREVEFIFARQHNLWMLVAPEFGTMTVQHHRSGYTGLVYSDSSDMLPGETRTFRRWVLVGEEDPAYLFSKVLEKRPVEQYGTLVGTLIEREETADGVMIEKGPVINEKIFITPVIRSDFTSDNQKNILGRPYIIAETDNQGVFNAFLPVGEYRIIPAPASRLAPMPNTAARIESGRVEAVEYGTSRSSRLLYQIVDEEGNRVPGKITIEPLRLSDPINLGPPGELRSGNTVISLYGAGIIDLPQGNYKVTASRGPEYHTTEHRVTIKQLQDTQQIFEVKRAFETPGWVSADIGVRTNETPTSKVNPRTRIASALAEGVEWLVTGDDQKATDLEPYVAELGVQSQIKTSIGYRHPNEKAPFRGDFLVFPIESCLTGLENQLLPLLQANSSTSIIQEMRSLCPEATLMLSKAIWPTGYLSLNGYTDRDGILPDGDWSRDFDTYNVWDGKRQSVFEENYAMYHQLIQDGVRVAAIGGSDSYGTLNQETGYPRVYIKSSTDDPAQIDPLELSANIKNRLVSVTNGPYVEFTANGQPMGSLVTDTDGRVDLDLKVYAANWVKPNSLSINVNGKFVRKIVLNNVSPDENGMIFPLDDSVDGGLVRARVKEDAIIDILVTGSKEGNMDPVNPFNLNSGFLDLPTGQYPIAISAPIYIDADGDGKITLEGSDISTQTPLLSDPNDAPF